MPSAYPKCKLCGVEHALSAPHVWADSSRAVTRTASKEVQQRSTVTRRDGPARPPPPPPAVPLGAPLRTAVSAKTQAERAAAYRQRKKETPMADPTKCARCGKTLTEADKEASDKMPLCASCRSSAGVRAPREQGSD